MASMVSSVRNGCARLVSSCSMLEQVLVSKSSTLSPVVGQAGRTYSTYARNLFGSSSGTTSLGNTVSGTRTNHLLRGTATPTWMLQGKQGYSYSTEQGKDLLESMEHTTGLELYEKEGLAKGINVFTEGEAWLSAPFGTPEKPVVVTSSFSERIVGVTDPEDDSIVVWDFIREGEPPKQIVENGEYFVLKKIDNHEEHFKQHTWELKKEDLDKWLKEAEEKEQVIAAVEKEFAEGSKELS